jgi:hypothetical protein
MTNCPNCGFCLDESDPVAERVAQLRQACVAAGRWVSHDGRVHESTAAWLLDRAPGTLRNWRAQNAPLPFQKVRGRYSYALEDIARMQLDD